MMHLCGLVLLVLFLLGGARRSTIIVDFRHDVQQQDNTLVNRTEVSAGAREAFIPLGVHRAGPRAGGLRYGRPGPSRYEPYIGTRRAPFMAASGGQNRKPIIGGNWKSNPDSVSTVKDLVDTFKNAKFDKDRVDVVLCPTTVHGGTVVSTLGECGIEVGIQSISRTGPGAFTGEVTAAMAKEMGYKWALIGHSERRALFAESIKDTAKKVVQAQEAGLKVMFCVGETLEEREKGLTDDVNAKQLDSVLPLVTDWDKFVIAYEPVWAIGTGKVATPEQAQETHANIRAFIREKMGDEIAERVRIQYGGSANPENIAGLADNPDIDGFLVGGASLKPEFTDMIEHLDDKATTDIESRAAKDGDEVLVQYRGSFEDGTAFDLSHDEEPLSLKIGAGQVIPGFEAAVRGLRVGQNVSVTLPPEQGYGQRNEQLVVSIPAAQVPYGLQEGMQVMLGTTIPGQKVPATVTTIKEDGSAVVDANPPLAGKTLLFDIKLVGFKEPMEMIGWQGKKLDVPIANSNSRVSKAFQNFQWPAAWPYKDSDFRRQDESSDGGFYNEPRFVAHIDDNAIAAIRNFYGLQFALASPGEYSVLDICSSWISHYPEDLQARRVAITGMVEQELAANKQATEYVVKDLNEDPKLPFGDNEFDFVTNVVSVDYLNKPREIFKEIHRVMKPGGVAIMSFSNRCFPHKAIAMWVADMNDGPGHCQIVGNYFHFNPEGGWRDISSADISLDPGRSDPMWVVTAVKA